MLGYSKTEKLIEELEQEIRSLIKKNKKLKQEIADKQIELDEAVEAELEAAQTINSLESSLQ